MEKQEYVPGKPCRYLKTSSKGRTYCKTYKNRIGKLMGYDSKGNSWRCTERKNSWIKNYPGCPYNKD
jgi:hypothetical protein